MKEITIRKGLKSPRFFSMSYKSQLPSRPESLAKLVALSCFVCSWGTFFVRKINRSKRIEPKRTYKKNDEDDAHLWPSWTISKASRTLGREDDRIRACSTWSNKKICLTGHGQITNSISSPSLQKNNLNFQFLHI